MVQLFLHGVLSEPTLTVSPWFEARRTEYYDRLLGVSTHGAWDDYVAFFSTGLEEAATLTHRQMLSLISTQRELKETVRASKLRADTGHLLVDHAIAHTSFTVRGVSRDLAISYPSANSLVGQLVDLGILRALDGIDYNGRFYAPAVLDVILNGGTPSEAPLGQLPPTRER